MTALIDHRLVFVTGKGGVGKTTVAAALGGFAANEGRRVLVCETAAVGGLSRAFGCGATGYRPIRVRPGLWAMTMDTEAALREYLKLNLKVPMVGRIGPLAQAFDFAATAAPGVREVLTVGKLCFEVREDHYDLVVVDASASGSIVGQLATPVALSDLVRIGSVKHQTAWMLDILRDPSATGVAIVTTAEELPVNESIELARRLSRETEVQLCAVIANRVLPELFAREEADVFAKVAEEPIRTRLAAMLSVPPPVVDGVIAAARIAVRLRRTGARHLDRLRAAIDPGVPVAYLPYLFATPEGPATTADVSRFLTDEFA